jgi:hypothetical protein
MSDTFLRWLTPCPENDVGAVPLSLIDIDHTMFKVISRTPHKVRKPKY